MQKFQETDLASASSTRPVNFNKPIPNTFKLIQLKRMLNTTQLIKHYSGFCEISTVRKRDAREKGLGVCRLLQHLICL